MSTLACIFNPLNFEQFIGQKNGIREKYVSVIFIYLIFIHFFLFKK